MSLGITTYRLPTEDDEGILRDYIDEHYSCGEYDLTATMDLENMAYAEWIDKITRDAEFPRRGFGRTSLLLCFSADNLVGLLSVRYELIQKFREKYGDIGYAVRPCQRKKGFASEMLLHGLEICRQHGRKDVIIGCFKDNPVSAKIIRKNGGKLIGEYDGLVKGRLSQYYRIGL